MWTSILQGIASYGVVLVALLVQAAVFAGLGIWFDTIAFGGWRSHSPFQLHYRRALFIVGFVAVGMMHVAIR